MYTELFNSIYGQDKQSGMPRIAIGVLTGFPVSEGMLLADGSHWVLMDEEGRIVTCPLSAFVADIRYRDGEWHDVGPGAA